MASSSSENKEQVPATDKDDEGDGGPSGVPVCPLLKRYRLLSWATSQKNVSSPTHTAAYALDTAANNMEVFIKFAMDSTPQQKLRQEVKIIKHLTMSTPYSRFLAINRKVGLPMVANYDITDRCHYMVTLKAGSALEILHEVPGASFSFSALAKLALRLLEIVEYIHETGYIHRDIHPGNVIISGNLEADEYVTLIDFADSIRFISEDQHIDQEAEFIHDNSYKSYCSANHENHNFSRKHDIEMIGILLVELKGKVLPYRKIKLGNRKQKRRHMKKARFAKPLKETCEGLQLPEIFLNFILYSRSMPFVDKPDYEFWKGQFQQLL